MIYREYTECYSISFLFLFFFHQSSLYPVKIFAKCFYLLVKKKVSGLSQYLPVLPQYFGGYFCWYSLYSVIEMHNMHKVSFQEKRVVVVVSEVKVEKS